MKKSFFSKILVSSALSTAFVLGGTMAAQSKDVNVSGRLQLETTFADDRGTDLQKSEIRRARLGIKGKYGDNVSYKVEFNYDSGNEIELEDGYVEFKLPSKVKVKVKVGQFKTPNSLDEQTSSRFISALERSAFTDAFGFSRQLGAALGFSGDNYKVDIGVFGENVNSGTNDKQDMTVAGRVAFNPVKDDGKILHLAASARYRNVSEGNSLLRYRQRPFTHVASSRIVSTPRIGDSDLFIGAEAAYIADHFWAAGEYGLTNVDGGGDPSFNGYYVEAGYFFGGKKGYKGYKFNRPKVDNPVTEGGHGAFSVLARYDSIDLDDVVNAGQLDTLVLGADWWPTKYTRLGVNYFNADADSFGDASGIVARIQFDF